ncbi:MAG: hypothetical protein C0503_00410 [Gemmatimonas sp.]|nr:hypothetical protein [Gemmatimonas sp.]
MPKRPAVSFDWSEGRFFDRWMLVHFLSGVAGGFSNRWFELSTPMVFVVAVAMMAGWEFGEWKLGVTESLSNIVIDIMVGCAGVGLALAIATRLSPTAEVVAFVATFSVAAAGGVLGFVAYRRRNEAK